MMTLIFNNLKMSATKLANAADNIRAQIAQQGQEVDTATVMKTFILPHFETALKEIQDEVLEQFDADEEELEEAVEYYIAQGELVYVSFYAFHSDAR